VVSDAFDTGVFYCLNVHESDRGTGGPLPGADALRLRVLEGIPRTASGGPGSSTLGIPPLLPRRVLGEIDVEDDGSFSIQVPANTPIQLQLLDEQGMATRSCSWIWVRNRETRGCVGCHEDAERTPSNRFVKALHHAPIKLDLAPERRRSVDFRRDVTPILNQKCATAACHVSGGTEPLLDAGPAAGESPFNRAYRNLLAPRDGEGGSSPMGKYVHPGRARTSPLMGHIYGKSGARPWDPEPAAKAPALMPPQGSEPLTEDQKRTLVEWIDFGALWEPIPGGAR
jgi:hypothetical protein